MKGATPVLLKVLLFQLSGRGNPHDDATPNFISDSGSCISGLPNELTYVSEFLFKTRSKQSKHLTENLGGCLFYFRTVY